MDDLHGLFSRLTDVFAEAVCAGFLADMDRMEEVRDEAEVLRAGAAAQAALGATLDHIAAALIGQVTRKAAARYRQYRDHPRHGREPLIDEAEMADVSFNHAVVAAQANPGPRAVLGVTLATIRVQAITDAIGSACVYPKGSFRGRRQRRRDITAADVPPAVGDLVLRTDEGGLDAEQAWAELRELEHGPENEHGLVSKLLVLRARPDGEQIIRDVAARVRRARVERGVSVSTSPDVYGGGAPPTGRTLSPVRSSTPLNPGTHAGTGAGRGHTKAAGKATMAQRIADRHRRTD